MKPDLVIVSYVDADQKRRMEDIVRDHRGRRLSPLLAAGVVRQLGAIAPLRCPCGCGRHVSAEEMAQAIERRAVLS